MSDSPPPLPESSKKSEEPRDSAVAWKLGGAGLGAIALVAGARVCGFPNALLDPFGLDLFAPVFLAIIALIGANAGALLGLLASRLRQRRVAKSVLNNSNADVPLPQARGEKPVKQGWRVLAVVNAGVTLGGLIGGIGGCSYLASRLPEKKGEVSMGIFLLPFQLIQALFFLFQVIIFATAGALIGALIGSLVSIFRGKR